METISEKPSLKDQKAARESLSAFSSALSMKASDLVGS